MMSEMVHYTIYLKDSGNIERNYRKLYTYLRENVLSEVVDRSGDGVYGKTIKVISLVEQFNEINAHPEIYKYAKIKMR